MSSQAVPSSPHTKSATAGNPLLEPSGLPLGFPRFDLIRDEHFRPAFAAAIREHAAEIEAIASNPEPPTPENTVVALERSGRTLDRVASVFYNLVGTDANDERMAIDAEVSPRLAAHADAMYLDERLFARIDALNARLADGDDRGGDDGVDEEERRLVERYHRDFRRRGAGLGEADKARLRAINERLSVLSTRFGDTLLADTGRRAVHVSDESELAGLGADARTALAAAAKGRGLDGWLIPLGLPTVQPISAELEDRDLRRRLYTASTARGRAHAGDAPVGDGPGDNAATALETVRLRAERAELLGYPNHAEYVIEVETAGNASAARRLLEDLLPAALTNARHEAKELADLDPELDDFEAWDWARAQERLRAERFAFDSAALRPYLPLERVVRDGVFHAAERLYGIRVVERHDLPVYHPTVRTWDVFDVDGARLAILVTDFFSRPSKRGGAWMSSFVDQSRLLGTLPVVVNVLGVTPPAEGEEALLTLDEVTTLFHEFGHALHGILSDVRYPRFSGTNVPRDFVEFPSQVNEMWALDPEILANYARHHETGEPMPRDLVDKVLAARRFGEGFATTEFILAAVLDHAWHSLTSEEAAAVTDVDAFERRVLADAGLDADLPVAPRYRTTYFNHVFAGGYSAAYYSYLWAEMLDADASEWMTANGGATRENGDRLRSAVLSRGGTIDYLAAYREMRGRDAGVDALLRRRGLELAATD